MEADAARAQSAFMGRERTASLDRLLNDLRDPAVRDLAWLLLSADLLRPQLPVGVLAELFESSEDLRAASHFLRTLDASPEALHRDLAATRMTRLGRYAERLLGWFLQQGPAARLVAAGVQVRHARVTLGECDFLVQTKEGARLHWELATKCYLHAGLGADRARSNLTDYVGPNLKDRFDLKLAHVLKHQLPLSARAEFAALGFPGPWTPQMLIKGWLFYRYDFQREAAAGDAVELDPSHHRGWWTTRAEWPRFAEQHASHWRALTRLEWLAPRRDGSVDKRPWLHGMSDAAEPPVAFVDSADLAEQTRDQQGPVMVGEFAHDASGDWVERSRGFIVPDDWPQQAFAFAQA